MAACWRALRRGGALATLLAAVAMPATGTELDAHLAWEGWLPAGRAGEVRLVPTGIAQSRRPELDLVRDGIHTRIELEHATPGEILGLPVPPAPAAAPIRLQQVGGEPLLLRPRAPGAGRKLAVSTLTAPPTALLDRLHDAGYAVKTVAIESFARTRWGYATVDLVVVDATDLARLTPTQRAALAAYRAACGAMLARGDEPDWLGPACAGPRSWPSTQPPPWLPAPRAEALLGQLLPAAPANLAPLAGLALYLVGLAAFARHRALALALPLAAVAVALLLWREAGPAAVAAELVEQTADSDRVRRSHRLLLQARGRGEVDLPVPGHLPARPAQQIRYAYRPGSAQLRLRWAHHLGETLPVDSTTIASAAGLARIRSGPPRLDGALPAGTGAALLVRGEHTWRVDPAAGGQAHRLVALEPDELPEHAPLATLRHLYGSDRPALLRLATPAAPVPTARLVLLAETDTP